MKELKSAVLDQVTGGTGLGPTETYCNEDRCGGSDSGPLHQWVKTGHEERWLFWLWTRGYDLYECALCHKTKDVSV